MLVTAEAVGATNYVLRGVVLVMAVAMSSSSRQLITYMVRKLCELGQFLSGPRHSYGCTFRYMQP